MNKRNILYAIVLGIGGLQTFGYLLPSRELRGLGLATASSPLPLVFTDVRGLETFASRFTLRYTTDYTKEVVITPEVYSRFPGPYNRRNVYGAAFAYAPLLPDSLRTSVLRYALCQGNLLQAMGLEKEPVSRAELTIQTKTRGRADTWRYPIPCD